MFDREIVMDSLQKIRKAIETITERAAVVDDPNELLCSPSGMMRLDAICMPLSQLLVCGRCGCCPSETGVLW